MDEKGMTLVEVVVVIVIVGLLMGPLLSLFSQGYRLSAQATGQSQIQNEANRVLAEICEGNAPAGRPGLLQAEAVAVSPVGLALRSGGQVVTYYLASGSIYRKVAAVTGPLRVDPSGGEAILSGVKSFTVGPGGLLYSLRLEMEHPNPDGTVNRFTLQTAVRPRNLHP